MLDACTKNANLVNSHVVEVNGHVLSAKELGQALARRLKPLDALAAKDPVIVTQAKEKVIRDFIVQSVVDDYAKLNNISLSEADLDKEVGTARSTYPDDLSFRRVLAQEDLSMSEWRKQLGESLLTAAVFKKLRQSVSAPTDLEIKRYYEENKERFKRKERIYLRQIVVDDLTKAQALHDELLKKKDFAKAAETFSVSPEAKHGGVVGWVEKGSVDIFDKAFLLPLGGISSVLESSYGFHIFKVERKAPAGQASLDESKPEIIAAIKSKKEQVEFMGWLDKQIRQARVLRNNSLVAAIHVETKGKK
jgi:peptidyl-prolyl cis-trans isomerase C